ncbi:MAG: hypothetical protein AAF998_18225 [Bacteroidota bacterium]
MYIFLLFIAVPTAPAQELFIHNNPASVLPRDAIAVRTISGLYKEDGYLRFRQGLRVGFGILSAWQMAVEVSFSNHNHPGLISELFGDGTVDHSHHNHGSGEGDINEEHLHPFQLNGITLSSQYRFFTSDGPNRHLRAATYQVLSTNFTTHNFAEPNLQHRTAGATVGLIGTWLRNKFAASLRLGGIYSLASHEKETGRAFKPGNALEYALSLGYLAFPTRYKSYQQLNINFYAEFMGRWFRRGLARDTDGIWYYIENSPETDPGRYLEFRPGLQFILNSRMRADFSTALPFLGRSYTMDYPQFQLNLQYLFFR